MYKYIYNIYVFIEYIRVLCEKRNPFSVAKYFEESICPFFFLGAKKGHFRPNSVRRF